MKPDFTPYMTAISTSIDDAWFQAIYHILKIGRKYTVTSGSFAGSERMEFDFFTAVIHRPDTRPLLPTMPEGSDIPPPADEAYLNQYMSYLMEDSRADNEQYTYGERIKPQLQRIIETYRNGSGTAQMVIQVAAPQDLLLTDPPCLRHIDTKIINGKLVFYPYFRSWDLWGGFPVNLAAIQLLKEYMCAEIGVGDGPIIASSKGLHLYDHHYDVARMRVQKN